MKTPSERLTQVLKNARRAAIRCVDAVREFYEASLIQDEQEPPDYRRYVTRLYATLRMGWTPIFECWPELAEETERGFRLRAVKRDLAAPVSAWIMAADVFWVAVVGTTHYESARKAWQDWSKKSIPVIEDGNLNRDANVAACVHIRRLFSGHRDDVWTQWIAEIEAAEPKSQNGAIADLTGAGKPPLPTPRKPLPEARNELSALLQRGEEFVLLFERAVLEGKLAFASQWAAIKADDLGLQIDVIKSAFAPPVSQLLVLRDELEPYLDPIVERASWHQVVAWYEVFAQLDQSGRTEVDKCSPSVAPRLKTLRTGLGTALAPYKLLRRQIYTKLDQPQTTPQNKGYLSVSDLAEQYGVPKDALARRLERWRKKQRDGWIEDANPKKNEPRYYYEQMAVQHILKEMTGE